MENWFGEYSLFLAKLASLVLALLVALAGLAVIARRARPHGPERLEVRHLNRRYDAMAERLSAATAPPRRSRLLRGKGRSSPRPPQSASGRPRLFVLDFQGDLRASAVASLREEISAVLASARPGDEVLLRLDSAGGQVHAYGLAASQLGRLRQAGVPLTVAVDKIAASGGYLMASVANRILAAPFAVLGSIGVVAQLPNFNRVLKKHDVDYEQFTAGTYKRTVTLFGENTEAGREKFQADVDTAHRLLQAFIAEYRPGLDLERVATGEYWLGSEALALKLIDELGTSDDFLMRRRQTSDLLQLHYRRPRQLPRSLRALLGPDA